MVFVPSIKVLHKLAIRRQLYEIVIPHMRRSHRMHSSCSEAAYVDSWFESIIKPTEFYAKHATHSTVRRYFYNVDLHGRLFLEETLPKNITSCIKDEKFLNFFFSRVQKVRKVDRQFLVEEGIDNEYPFVSLCGKEVNFIRPAATPIVFHSLQGNTLYFGGTLQYEKSSPGEYGLIRSSVAVTLSDRIKPGPADDNDLTLYFCLEGQEFLMDKLPTASEPGEWALPTNL